MPIHLGKSVNKERYARRFALGLSALLTAWSIVPTANAVEFESGHVRPLAMSPDGTKLFAVNTPNNTLEIFNVGPSGIAPAGRVPVGLEPVAVAVRNNFEVWVVNHLSDSVSVVSLTGTPRVTRTLLVGDEPRDIVFAGTTQERAFITTAHRGQHRTDPSLSNVPGAGDPQLTTPGVGRADVWVFNTAWLGAGAGGTPTRIMTFFSDTPRALAVSPNKTKVYVAAFKSGNQTTLVNPDYICANFATAPCVRQGVTVPGGLPGPSTNFEGQRAPQTSLVVKFDPDSGRWLDNIGRNWSAAVGLSLPDLDVFALDANSLTQTASVAHVGTTLFNMVANPVSGKLYVSNMEAMNHIRFEGPGVFGGTTVQGQIAKTRITVIDGVNAAPRHLNKHIDYNKLAGHAGFDPTAKNHSLSMPLEMAVSSNGGKLYVAAFGSSKIGVFNTATLESGAFNPRNESANYINVSGGGPSGLVLDEARNRLYVTTRFDNAVKVINLANRAQIDSDAMPNPEPQSVVAGRPMLYDANLTSANGESSCASCHIFGDKDEIAWDLGNPDDHVTKSPIPLNFSGVSTTPGVPGGIDIGKLQFKITNLNGTDVVDDFHPMKGPMTTQTLRGLRNSGAMHWRGDRSNGFFGVDGYTATPDNTLKRAAYGDDEVLNFKNFIVALGGLLGKATPATGPTPQDVAIMEKFTTFQLRVQLPPNPVRKLDNSHTAAQARGRDIFMGPLNPDGTRRPFDGLPGLQQPGAEPASFTCNGCHLIDPAAGHFGTQGEANFEGETQLFKVPHLRDLYTKVGMWGTKNLEIVRIPGAPFMGNQIRGFGFIHDGQFDTLFRFVNLVNFNDPQVQFEKMHQGTPTEAIALQLFSSSFGKMGFPYNEAAAAPMQRDVEQFLLAFDTDLAPIVGQQITFGPLTASSAGSRIDLLKSRARASFTSKVLGGTVKECDLVVRMPGSGGMIGYLYDPATDRFKASNGSSITDAQLRTNALAGGREATYTCAVPGTGSRVAFGT